MRCLGPYMRRHRIALTNLALAFPEKTPQERERVARDMWEHLGRIFAELPFLKGTKLTSRVEVSGIENLPKAGQVAIFVSGHIGQWELLMSLAYDKGVPTAAIYRHINNPWLDTWLYKRRVRHTTQLIRKGRDSAVQILKAMKAGQSLSMLADQKITGGLELPFFGHTALINATPARMAVKSGYPIIPAFIIREQGAHFKATILPPLRFDPTGNVEADIEIISRNINTLLEEWIRKYPEQWLWVHKRWKVSY